MDPLTFPMLAGTMLTEAVKFLFDRAGAVLDRRAGRVPVEEPEQVAGRSDLLQVRVAELTDTRAERLMHAQGALRVYLSRPELLDGEDAGLRELLGQLRRDLEEVYGCGLPFGNEHRPRPGVEVSQHSDEIAGQQVGVRAQGITAKGQLHVVQTAKTIAETGEQVGVHLEGPIG
ncbi:hypothetical protein GCM10010329_22810 [Streptomyces spiroverticillatus]|uniref:Uncharacterized protein n=1 Tax=Streptomyces finlayi TaxID=67296 RepID=A0A918WUQ8_9ACTN|nr:hypothetical protein [Streptomyces finlayi]GHA00428.1 hypothetical protein GCM10010329_22810 [Streptomyces spiroverticillatus]GHC84892.1 hypothetical protein GCM10010334_15230 [Streptomyces finlayi]